MDQDFGTPIPPISEMPPQPEKKRNTTVIIIVVILLVLCCCCVLIGGLLWTFGDTIMESLDLSSLVLPLVVV